MILHLWVRTITMNNPSGGGSYSGCILSECLSSLSSREQKQWCMCQPKTQNLTVEQTLDCYVPLSSQSPFLYGQVLTVVNRCRSIFHTNWGELHLILCFPHELGPPQSLTKNHQTVWNVSFIFFCSRERFNSKRDRVMMQTDRGAKISSLYHQGAFWFLYTEYLK